MPQSYGLNGAPRSLLEPQSHFWVRYLGMPVAKDVVTWATKLMCYLHIVVSYQKLISSALPFHISVPSHQNKILEPWTYNQMTFALTNHSPSDMHTHLEKQVQGVSKLLAIWPVKVCGGWELKSPPESKLPAVSSMTARRTIPGSVVWCLKNKVSDSAATAPYHPAFSAALGLEQPSQ